LEKTHKNDQASSSIQALHENAIDVPAVGTISHVKHRFTAISLNNARLASYFTYTIGGTFGANRFRHFASWLLR
jgi:hypothetical protein